MVLKQETHQDKLEDGSWHLERAFAFDGEVTKMCELTLNVKEIKNTKIWNGYTFLELFALACIGFLRKGNEKVLSLLYSNKLYTSYA